MKTLLASIAVFCVTGFCCVAHAQIIYSDSFEGEPSNTIPAGFTMTSSPTPFAGTGSAAVEVLSSSDYNFGFTNYDGNNYVKLDLNGPNSGGDGIDEAVPESVGITNANVGTFAANTTYTLTYLLAVTDGDIATSLQSNGANVATQDVTVNTSTSSPMPLVAGTSVVIDTALDPSLVNTTIGIQSVYNSTLEYSRSNAVDDFVLTAVTDVPEPSSYALISIGVMLLLGLQRIRRAIWQVTDK